MSTMRDRYHAMAMKLTRRQWLCGAVVLLPPRSNAQARFPSRPVTLWVPWPAGGATDLTLRVLADGASRDLGQKVYVENRAGAGGTLAMPILRAPWTQKVLWDPIRDVTPIIQISGVTFGVVVPESSPLHSLEDLFAWARAHEVPRIVCEYYSMPLNEASQRFHARAGFSEVGTQWLPDGSKQVSFQVAPT